MSSGGVITSETTVAERRISKSYEATLCFLDSIFVLLGRRTYTWWDIPPVIALWLLLIMSLLQNI